MQPASRSGTRVLRGAVLGLGGVLAAFFVFVVVQRFRMPVDVEWMTGSIRDHVARVNEGKPVYAAPSSEWIPFLYPPLYYWVSALVSRMFSVTIACRLVSVVSTLASVALIHRLSARLGATRYWAWVGALLFVGAYSFVKCWYDVERCDSLFTAMLLAGAVVLAERRSLAGAAMAGAIFGAAFFAKQQALPVLAGGVVGVLAAGERRRALALGAAGAGVVVPGVIALHLTTGGWFERYCLDLPAAHGIAAKLITVFFVLDLSDAFLFTVTTFLVLAGATRQVASRMRARGERAAETDPWSSEGLAFAGLLAGAFFAAASSRLHLGGWPNVLMPWIAFACAGTAIVASRVEAASAHAGTLACAAALMQLGHFAYDPSEVAPDAATVAQAATLEARVRALETRGDVVLTGRGGVTAHRHFHSAALVDLVRAGKPIPEDLLANVRAQRYAAYVIDERGEIAFDEFLHAPGPLFEALVSHYYVAERWSDKEPPLLIGWTAHPAWVLLPRKAPLEGLDVKALERRYGVETGLAEMRMRATQAGVTLPPEDIEREAGRIDRGSGAE